LKLNFVGFAFLVLILVLMFMIFDPNVLIRNKSFFFYVDHGGVEVGSC